MQTDQGHASFPLLERQGALYMVVGRVRRPRVRHGMAWKGLDDNPVTPAENKYDQLVDFVTPHIDEPHWALEHLGRRHSPYLRKRHL